MKGKIKELPFNSATHLLAIIKRLYFVRRLPAYCIRVAITACTTDDAAMAKGKSVGDIKTRDPEKAKRDADPPLMA